MKGVNVPNSVSSEDISAEPEYFEDPKINFPQMHHSGNFYQVPDKTYLREGCFLVEEERRYVYFVRHHRAQVVDVDINREDRYCFIIK